MKKKYPQWYQTVGLKHVTGFLTVMEKQKLRRYAQMADKSLSRYVTRLLQNHIKEMEEKERMEREKGGNDESGKTNGHGEKNGKTV